MKIADIKPGDVLVSTDSNGTGYYRVLKVCAVKVKVRSENQNEFYSYPCTFDRKVNYAVDTLL